jgi:hypothetical protein
MADFAPPTGTYRSGTGTRCAVRATTCRERPTAKGERGRIPLARKELGVSHPGDAPERPLRRYLVALLPAAADPELRGLLLPAEADPEFTCLPVPTDADRDPAEVLATIP